MRSKEKNAISPTREQDYAEWYQQVIRAADLAENSPVRGCMVIKPWGFGIWEKIQRIFDLRIKETGHENAYFPLFIPLSYLEREAKHVEGFAKECAVVTHHRLVQKEGKLLPDGELEEPLIVRPTSEMIIAESFSRWISSYRDLPLLLNQWANVVRWEMRPRIFLRTTEFLWQEGHTAHADAKEAREETFRMLEEYRKFFENVLAIPVYVGEKSPGERFPGAVNTYTLEAMMQDRKALQCCTSHYFGQNFAKAANIMFTAKEGDLRYCYTTSWGLATRTIGGVIMVHGDDDGLRLPPKIAPKQVAIIPVIPKEEVRGQVLRFCEKIRDHIGSLSFAGENVVATVDRRDIRGGDKFWEWVKKGIPLRLEVGPKEVEKNSVTLYRRDRPHKERLDLDFRELSVNITLYLEEIQRVYLEEARRFRDEHTCRDVKSFADLQDFFASKNARKPEILGGFVLAKWCGDPETEKLLAELKTTIRCLPFEQSGTAGKCVITGKDASLDVIIAKSY